MIFSGKKNRNYDGNTENETNPDLTNDAYTL